jgi:site-specific DNA recombinase
MDDETFERVQQMLTAQSPGLEAKRKRATSALLKGMVFDAQNRRLLPTHCNKKGQRYHYYTSEKRLREASQEPDGLRIPALDLEEFVIKAITSKLTNDQWLTEHIDAEATDIPKLIKTAKALAGTILDKTHASTQTFRTLIHRVIVEKSCITINLNKTILLQLLNHEVNRPIIVESEATDQSPNILQIIIQSHLLRCGKQMKFILGNDASNGKTNPQLINLVVQAKLWFAGLSIGKYSSLSNLAKTVNLDKAHVSRVITLAFLAPNILEQIITGNHSHLLTPERLRKACPLPLDWQDQRALLQVCSGRSINAVPSTA